MTYASVLRQFSDDPMKHNYIDEENRPAFTFSEVAADPNSILRLIRETTWSSQHPNILGPENSFMYLGPARSAGYVVYGNNTKSVHMNAFLKPGKRENTISRYFKAQTGREFKWRAGSHRMECVDGRSVIAVWEVSAPESDHYATLSIKTNALPFITEIVTALTLNRLARANNWPPANAAEVI